MKKYKNPLSRHIFIGCLVFVVMLCIIMGLIGFIVFQDRMMKQYESHLSDIIELTEARLDVEDLKECIRTGEESEKYKELLVFLDQVRQNYSLDHIVLTQPVHEGDSYDLIQVASGLLPEERNGTNLRDIAIPLLGDRMGQNFDPDFLPLIYDQFVMGKGIEFRASDSDFGKVYTGAVTINDNDGRPFLQLTAGMTLAFIESTMEQYIIIVIIATVVLSLLFLAFMMVWLRRRVIVPLKNIEKAASEFEEKSRSRKDPDALVLDIPEIHTGDELESLSDTLSLMSNNMKKYVEELLESAKKVDSLEQDLDESKEREIKLGELVNLDPLTGIRNKAAYDKEVEKVMWELEGGNRKFGVAMIDLNYLKRINDTFGHDKGNIAIIKLCHLVCNTFVHSPVFRIGGDEFVVILKGQDYNNVYELVQQFNDDIDISSSDNSVEYWERTSAAIGYALYDKDIDSGYDNVFRRADKAMYERKKEMKAVRE